MPEQPSESVTTVNLGAAFRPDGTCYGCFHREESHTIVDHWCLCCSSEAKRRTADNEGTGRA